MVEKVAKGNYAKQTEADEGVYLDDLAPGTVLELETQSHHYTLVKCDGSDVLISGHPTFCPEPVVVHIEGSFIGPCVTYPERGFIGRGMHLMFRHPVYDTVSTSLIREIHRHG